MATQTFKRRKLIIGGALGLLIVVLVDALNRPAPPLPPLPNPNGYDDFVAAGKLHNSAGAGYWDWDNSQRKAHLDGNQAALIKLREGLKKQSAVPVQYSEQFLTQHIGTWRANKGLLMSLKIEAMLATAEERWGDAAEASLDCLRFGNASAKGGLMLDAMNGQTERSMGVEYLFTTLTNYDAPTCRRVAAEVARIDAEVEPVAPILDRDWRWTREVYSLLDRVKVAVEIRSLSPGKQVESRFERNYLRDHRRLRQLILAIASRAYELEKGRPPKSAGDLVPEYLKTVPKDPLTGTNLLIQP